MIISGAMATSDSEESAKAAAGNEEKKALEKKTLEAAIGYNILVKWALCFIALFCWACILLQYDKGSLTYQLHPYKPGWFGVLPLIIGLTGMLGFFYVRFGVPRWNFPLSSSFDLTDRAKDFPLVLLFFDFVNLALLVAVTGGLESVFVPLFGLAVLLGEISIPKHKRWRMLALFLAAFLSGVLLPEIDPVRYLLINEGHSTSAESLLVLPRWATIAFGLTVNVVGVVFAGSVVRWYKDRLASGETATKANKPEAQPPNDGG